MKYHNITKDDILNGDGLRVVLWLSGCEHRCHNCQNPITWNPYIGLDFDKDAANELFVELEKAHVDGVTFSGGDPLHPNNRDEVSMLAAYIKSKYPDKTVWIYTGYLWDQIKDLPGLAYVDVVVDGKFVEELKDVRYHWAGSTNQRVIDVRESLRTGRVVLHDNKNGNTSEMEVYHENNCRRDA